MSNLAAWELFFEVEASASAALAGLVFVGVSVSLQKMLETRHLPGRALEAVTLLSLNLCVSLSAVAPQGAALLGAEIVVYVVIAGILIIPGQIRDLRHVNVEYRRWVNTLYMLSRVALIAHLALAGGLMLLDAISTPAALIAALLSMLLALANAWIVLVEIHR